VVVFLLGIGLGVAYAGGALTAITDELFDRISGGGSGFRVDLARAFNVLADHGVVLLVRLALIVALALAKRWRHLLVGLAAFALTDATITLLKVQLPRPPIEVVVEPTVSGNVAWYFPAPAVAALAITLFVACYSLVPAGRMRARALYGAALIAALVGLSRIVLGAAYPIAASYSVLLTFTVAGVLYHWLVPDGSFPVRLGSKAGGNAAHLDLSGTRSAAVKLAMRDQLGIEVESLKAFGDEGSGGSTPLLMRTTDGRDVFGKILATRHVRSDQWYRMGRTLLYGELEDEKPFSSVRRLIEYEDYALRVLDDQGFRVATTYGVVELTTDREYLLPTEFFAGAQTLGHAEVDETIVDEGLGFIRRMWDEGQAHRDIKPANLLVVDGHLQVIDVSGLEIRASGWRQAIDLANMMMVLGLRSDPDTVYERATALFTPEEIAEAFAAAQGMAIPTELQAHLKEDPRDVRGRFIELAPAHGRISIQRWSARRIVLMTLAVVGLTGVVALTVDTVVAGLP
jgi:hypothetical protein